MTIEEIKQQLTLAQILHYYHLKPDKNMRLCCPFHDDKTPSFQVYYKTHTAYCFSSNCKTHGKSLDVIDFIMHKENVTKHEAILKAKSMINGETIAKEPSRTEVLTNMFTYFKNGVPSSKQAKEYIKSRNLDYTNTEIGYNSGQFHHGKRKDESLIKLCIKYGILLNLGAMSRTGGPAYKPFGKHCIVFALKNRKDEIVSLYFRSTYNDKKQRHFYLKGREGLYPKYPPAETKKLILTESIIDAATMEAHGGIKRDMSVLALYGTNGLTKEHQEAIKNIKDLEEIIFFLNGDTPGIKAVEKYAPMLKLMLPKVKITSVEVPDNEDVNSLLQSHSAEVLSHLIETRKEYYFLFSSEKSTEKEKVEIPQIQEEKQAQSTKQVKGLDTTNPYNLKYKSNTANYQIKGFRMSQPDSLKITLQISVQ